jgi:hypothetical protein
MPPVSSVALPVTTIVDDSVGVFDMGTVGVGVTETGGVITNGATTLSDGDTTVTVVVAEDSADDTGTRVGSSGIGVGVIAGFGVGVGAEDGVGVGISVGVGIGDGVGVG